MAILTALSNLTTREFSSPSDLDRFRNRVDLLTLPSQRFPEYIAGFAVSDRLVEQALRLRFEIFNLELGEGLEESVVSGLDRDEFDDQMTHAVVLHRETGEPVGTYRLQTIPHALRNRGIYSAREFVLDPLEDLFPASVETGRACLAHDHRSMAGLLALWDAVAVFVRSHGCRYLFGCCSLTSTDPQDGRRAEETIRKEGYGHPVYRVGATEPYRCIFPADRSDPEAEGPFRLPRLFSIYTTFGAKVLSEPALDREFGTIDFLVMMDGANVSFV